MTNFLNITLYLLILSFMFNALMSALFLAVSTPIVKTYGYDYSKVKLITRITIVLFIVANLFAYVAIIRHANSVYETNYLNRWQLLALTLPMTVTGIIFEKFGNNLIVKSADQSKFKLDESLQRKQTKALQNIILGSALKFAFVETFWPHVLLLIWPSLQTYIL